MKDIEINEIRQEQLKKEVDVVTDDKKQVTKVEEKIAKVDERKETEVPVIPHNETKELLPVTTDVVTDKENNEEENNIPSHLPEESDHSEYVILFNIKARRIK